MKQTTLIIILLSTFSIARGQNSFTTSYSENIKIADSLFMQKDYRKSAYLYSETFKANYGQSKTSDRFRAAAAWALSGVADSAFVYLELLAPDYFNYDKVISDSSFISLKADSRWEKVLVKIKDNRTTGIPHTQLVMMLDSIYKEDQSLRNDLQPIGKKFGWDSKEVKDFWEKISEIDKKNLAKIIPVIEKYGWLAANEVGDRGNLTLFLVIQHADQATQEKYLPLIRAAVKDKKAEGGQLALLEDRVAMLQGKRQIYGSQIGYHPDTKARILLPLEDPDRVDKRRAAVGLNPIAEYLERYDIIWNPEQYKIDLPELEKKLKQKK